MVSDSLTGLTQRQPIVGFLGNEVEVQIFSPTLDRAITRPIRLMVNGGEFSALPSFRVAGNPTDATLEITNNSLLFSYEQATSGRFTSGLFNGYVITDVNNTIPDIIDLKVDKPFTNLGLKENDISFTKDSIFINVEGLGYTPNSIAKIDVIFASDIT